VGSNSPEKERYYGRGKSKPSCRGDQWPDSSTGGVQNTARKDKKDKKTEPEKKEKKAGIRGIRGFV